MPLVTRSSTTRHVCPGVKTPSMIFLVPYFLAFNKGWGDKSGRVQIVQKFGWESWVEGWGEHGSPPLPHPPTDLLAAHEHRPSAQRGHDRGKRQSRVGHAAHDVVRAAGSGRLQSPGHDLEQRRVRDLQQEHAAHGEWDGGDGSKGPVHARRWWGSAGGWGVRPPPKAGAPPTSTRRSMYTGETRPDLSVNSPNLTAPTSKSCRMRPDSCRCGDGNGEAVCAAGRGAREVPFAWRQKKLAPPCLCGPSCGLPPAHPLPTSLLTDAPAPVFIALILLCSAGRGGVLMTDACQW